MSEEQAVRAAVDQWFVALNAMLNGDPAPLSEVYSHADDVTYMGAQGSFRVGWDATYADWKEQAAKSSGGEVKAADLHIIVAGDTAVAQHYTRGQVRKPDGGMDENNVRETSVFRKEGNAWKMIAHHADGIAYWQEAFKPE